mmetsp:Transcript_52023/g.135930  ORF Transcript_52023/g.135930 Transcript_52023/m.135930 type:complete len:235 (+) Transcript_52023:475-1179(+)
MSTFLDRGVALDEDRQEDIEQDEQGEEDPGPEVDEVELRRGRRVQHLHVELGGVEVEDDDDEELGGAAHGREGLVLVAEHEHARDHVAHEDHAEERREVHQVREGHGDGARHERHARLEVQRLEQPQHEEDQADAGEVGVEAHGGAEGLEVAAEEQELALLRGVREEEARAGLVGRRHEQLVARVEGEVAREPHEREPVVPPRGHDGEVAPVEHVGPRPQVVHDPELAHRHQDV